jgi:hypothetical protein
MSTTSENLRAIDGYLNSLWEQATKLRDQHTGQAHADLNNLRHGIGAIPDGLLEAAARLDELERENAILREAVLRVHFELGEYIDANGGEVRVNVALAFEIARHAVEAALAGSEK